MDELQGKLLLLQIVISFHNQVHKFPSNQITEDWACFHLLFLFLLRFSKNTLESFFQIFVRISFHFIEFFTIVTLLFQSSNCWHFIAKFKKFVSNVPILTSFAQHLCLNWIRIWIGHPSCWFIPEISCILSYFEITKFVLVGSLILLRLLSDLNLIFGVIGVSTLLHKLLCFSSGSVSIGQKVYKQM